MYHNLPYRRVVPFVGALVVVSLFTGAYIKYPLVPAVTYNAETFQATEVSDTSEAATLPSENLRTSSSDFPLTATSASLSLKTSQHVSSSTPTAHSCELKDYDAFDPYMMKTFFTGEPKQCPSSNKRYFIYPEIHMDVGRSSARINKTILENVYNVSNLSLVSCKYSVLERNTQATTVDRHFLESDPVPLEFNTPLEAEYIWIKCDLPNKKAYEQPLLLAKVKGEDAVFKTGITPLNVLVFGIDSISALSFRRVLPKTFAYLQTKRNLIELRLYNKIGRNSAPNQGAILTGDIFEGPVEERAAKDEWRFDNASRYVWEDFEDLGFRTMFFEEQWYWGLFVYGNMKGFKKQPTTYWPLPALQKIDDSAEKKATSDYCNGGKYSAYYYLTYTAQLMELLGPKRPSFIYAWLSEMVHDDIRGGKRLDQISLDFLTKLESSGVMNNTALFFISDHGFNFGSYITSVQGGYENKLPFAFILFPEWFYKERPEVLENLQVNQKRLLTALDLHATLEELTNIWYPGRPIQTGNGKSILSNQLSPLRTCNQLGIPRDYCSCYDFMKVNPEKSPVAKAAAQFIVQQVNTNLDNDSSVAKACIKFKMDKPTLVLKFENRGYSAIPLNLYRVVVNVVPDATFESVVEVHKNGTVTLQAEIVRVDRFDKKASCLSDQPLKKFCYCRDLLSR